MNFKMNQIRTRRAIALSLALIMSVALVAFNPFYAFADETAPTEGVYDLSDIDLDNLLTLTPEVIIDETTGTAALDAEGNPIVIHPEVDEVDDLTNIDLDNLIPMTPEVGLDDDGNPVVTHPELDDDTDDTFWDIDLDALIPMTPEVDVAEDGTVTVIHPDVNFDWDLDLDLDFGWLENETESQITPIMPLDIVLPMADEFPFAGIERTGGSHGFEGIGFVGENVGVSPSFVPADWVLALPESEQADILDTTEFQVNWQVTINGDEHPIQTTTGTRTQHYFYVLATAVGEIEFTATLPQAPGSPSTTGIRTIYAPPANVDALLGDLRAADGDFGLEPTFFPMITEYTAILPLSDTFTTLYFHTHNNNDSTVRVYIDGTIITANSMNDHDSRNNYLLYIAPSEESRPSAGVAVDPHIGGGFVLPADETVVMQIRVTSEDETETETYTVTFTRPTPPPSNVNSIVWDSVMIAFPGDAWFRAVGLVDGSYADADEVYDLTWEASVIELPYSQNGEVILERRIIGTSANQFIEVDVTPDMHGSYLRVSAALAGADRPPYTRIVPIERSVPESASLVYLGLFAPINGGFSGIPTNPWFHPRVMESTASLSQNFGHVFLEFEPAYYRYAPVSIYVEGEYFTTIQGVGHLLLAQNAAAAENAVNPGHLYEEPIILPIGNTAIDLVVNAVEGDATLTYRIVITRAGAPPTTTPDPDPTTPILPPAPITPPPTVATPPIVTPGAGVATTPAARPSTRRVPAGQAQANGGTTTNVNLNIEDGDLANVVLTLPTRINARGIASLNISDSAVTQAIANLRTAARDARTSVNEFVIRVEALDDGINGVNATLQSGNLARLANANATLQIATNDIVIEFDPDALSQLQADTRGNIRINVTPPISLPTAFRETVGDNQVFNFALSTLQSGTVGNLESGNITLSIPAETDANLFIVTLENNQIVEVPATFEDGFFTWEVASGGVFGLANR
ncbi:MAG: hypothetical protein FWG68_02650 [Defluviitaleaceae bacterium]|nr:hypothetical protein [Defluviitaleaceae bacterium]